MRIERYARLLWNKGFLPLLVFTAVVLFPANVQGKGELELKVNNARGAAGETVGITVSISGMQALDGAGGISGGQFELAYDSTAAAVENVRPGSLITPIFTFMPNLHFTGSSIKIAWAAASDPITADGDLCNITFTLHQAGSVDPVLKNIILYDQELQPLAVKAAVTGWSDTGTGDPSPGADSEAEQDAAGDAVTDQPGEEEETEDEANDRVEDETEEAPGEDETAVEEDIPPETEEGIVPGGDRVAVGRSILKNPLFILAAAVAAGSLYFLLRRRR